MSASAKGRWLLIISGIAVIAVIATAISVIGTPSQQRMLREDERRVRDLGALKNEIEAWTRQQNTLPEDLALLANRPGVSLSVSDPFSGKPYEYRIVDARRYRLCATFVTDTADRANAGWANDWRHARGHQCFDRTLSKRHDD